MKSVSCVLILLLIVSLSYSASAQVAPLNGKITDVDGQRLANATVTMVSRETGRQFTAKTDRKGEFVVMNVPEGLYHMTISKDGKVLYEAQGKRIQDRKDLEIDLGKERAVAKEQQEQGLTAEQRKQIEEQQRSEQKSRENIASMNALLARAKQASDAGQFSDAASSIKQAIEIDPGKHLLWSRLGEAYLAAAGTASAHSNRDAASEDYSHAAEAYRKAIELKSSDAGYHNNLGQALGKLGKTDEAAAEYATAAQLDPTHAGTYYFNLGATLSNAGKIDEANAAFDRSIAADPRLSEAYYWKGVNLLGRATIDKSGKTVPVPGTVEAFKKYLELDPSGRYAGSAKEMLASIDSKVSTTFTRGKTK